MPLRLEKQNLADDAQNVAAAFLGRDEFLHLVGEQDEADLVAVADGGEGEHGGDLGREFALDCVPEPKRPEPLTSTTSMSVSSRSSTNFFTNGWFMRAVTFQSMERTSSPG